MSATAVLGRLRLLPLLLALAMPLQGQIQPNSAQASLDIGGQSGTFTLNAGDPVTLSMGGAPNSPVLLWSGASASSTIWVGGGWLNVWPVNAFLLDGTSQPTHALDPTGSLQLFGQIPWLTQPGLGLAAQGAVQDLGSSIGWTLTAPLDVTIGPPAVVAQHLFFDPTLGARGVPNVLPPAGSLPGDLPTLSPIGFPAPTSIFVGGLPVHGVFETPFTCQTCHGAVPEIWDSYQGTMMANAARDPLFNAQFSISVAGLEHLNAIGASHLGGELAADLCIRCHSPNAWHGGRSGFLGTGNPGDAYRPGIFDEQHALDMEGVTCDVCHRTTGFAPNATPTAFQTPGQPDSGQLIVAPTRTKRGPYPGTVATTYPSGTTAYGAHVPPPSAPFQPAIPHNPPSVSGTAVSPWHETELGTNLADSSFCGTCHNVSNPLNGHAVERTYTEWLNSTYSQPSSLDHKTCQDCHLPQVPNTQACTLAGADPVYGAFNKVRSFFRAHEYVGGNAWIPQILKQMYPLVDQNWANGNNYAILSATVPASRNALYDIVTNRAVAMLESAAEVDLTATEPLPGTVSANVRITNLSGHKLPTGYPEGRRMWIHLRATDAGGTTFFEVGALTANNDVAAHPQLKVYEAEHGLDYPALGWSGPSFHFVLNNYTHKDNRIPPKGNVAIPGRGGTDGYDPVSAPWPTGGLYPNYQHWDDTVFTINVPASAPRPIKVTATVFYQTTSPAYLAFLANGGDSHVQTAPHPDAVTLQNLWNTGYPAPAVPVGTVAPTSTADPTSSTPNSTAMVIIP